MYRVQYLFTHLFSSGEATLSVAVNFPQQHCNTSPNWSSCFSLSQCVVTQFCRVSIDFWWLQCAQYKQKNNTCPTDSRMMKWAKETKCPQPFESDGIGYLYKDKELTFDYSICCFTSSITAGLDDLPIYCYICS